LLEVHEYIPTSGNDSEIAIGAVRACIATREHRLGEVFIDFILGGLEPQTKVSRTYLTGHGRLIAARNDTFAWSVKSLFTHVCWLPLPWLTTEIKSRRRKQGRGDERQVHTNLYNNAAGQDIIYLKALHWQA
jgi:hypothetical protein